MKVALIFGGKSGEHEVSLVSAKSVVKALDSNKYEVIEVGITENGAWMTGENCLNSFKKKDYSNLMPVKFSADPENPGFFDADENLVQIDMAFPVLHGPFGEDGTIQGLFEMLNIPYVGCGVLASSTAMDKLQCKALWKAAGLPVVPYIGFNKMAWGKDKEKIRADIIEHIKFPLFVKPANMGSSVGISKVNEVADLDGALKIAFRFDSRILVEKAINAREIECAILGNDDVVASPLGEVIVGGEFYDFYDKYVNGVSTTQIPAELPLEASGQIRMMCIKAFKVLDCSGLARVDSFIDKDNGRVYLNEINTLPGFTSISMYPKMMEEYGMSYTELIDRLIELGLERHKKSQEREILFDSGSDWFVE